MPSAVADVIPGVVTWSTRPSALSPLLEEPGSGPSPPQPGRRWCRPRRSPCRSSRPTVSPSWSEPDAATERGGRPVVGRCQLDLVGAGGADEGGRGVDAGGGQRAVQPVHDVGDALAGRGGVGGADGSRGDRVALGLGQDGGRGGPGRRADVDRLRRRLADRDRIGPGEVLSVAPATRHLAGVGGQRGGERPAFGEHGLDAGRVLGVGRLEGGLVEGDRSLTGDGQAGRLPRRAVGTCARAPHRLRRWRRAPAAPAR